MTIPSMARATIPISISLPMKSSRAFSVLGAAEQHIAKLNILKDAGVTQFNIYLDNGKEEQIIAEYGETIIPAFGA